jgi:short-subunit dehydrogenase
MSSTPLLVRPLVQKLTLNLSINAAGVATDEPFLATSDKNLSSTFNVNVSESFQVYLTQAYGIDIVRWLFPSCPGLCQCYG